MFFSQVFVAKINLEPMHTRTTATSTSFAIQIILPLSSTAGMVGNGVVTPVLKTKHANHMFTVSVCFLMIV